MITPAKLTDIRLDTTCLVHDLLMTDIAGNDIPKEIQQVSLSWIKEEIATNWVEWAQSNSLIGLARDYQWDIHVREIKLLHLYIIEMHPEPHENDLVCVGFLLDLELTTPKPKKWKCSTPAWSARDEGVIQLPKPLALDIEFKNEHYYDRDNHPSFWSTLKLDSSPPVPSLSLELEDELSCPECGSTEIHGKFWIPINNPQAQGEMCGEEYWCNDCKSHFDATDVQ